MIINVKRGEEGVREEECERECDGDDDETSFSC